MGKLVGKVALVTGGGRGIGRSIALALAAEGAAVAVLSRTSAQVEEVATEIRDAGGRAIGFACDLTDEGAPERAVRQVAEALGPVDILINNAHDTSVEGMTATVESVAATQIVAQLQSGPLIALALIQACLPHMKEHGGRILNMASSVGIKRLSNFVPYAMAKEAMRAMSGVAARELAPHGITVNVLCPVSGTEAGLETIQANVVRPGEGAPPPIARMGDADRDIAPLVVFLAGPGAGYLTGYTYMLDGGGAIDAAR